MNQQKNCVFCKIIQEELPSVSITKTDNFHVFLDINPVNKGHLLIVPVVHTETVFEIPETIGTELVRAMKSIGSALMEAVKADGLNIFQNNYPAAGQEVPHTHWHLIPRFTDDQCAPWKRTQYADKEEMRVIAHKITTILYEAYS